MLLGAIALFSAAGAAGICLASQAFDTGSWFWLLPVLALGLFVLGILLAFVFLLLLAAAVDLNKEQKEDSRLYRKTVELYLQSALPPLRWHIHTKGMEKLPESGRFLLVCNHVRLACLYRPATCLYLQAGESDHVPCWQAHAQAAVPAHQSGK